MTVRTVSRIPPMLLVAALALAACAAPAPELDLEQLKTEAPRIQAEADTQPDNSQAQARAGLMFAAFGDAYKARPYLERTVVLDPNHGQAAVGMATILESEGRLDEAVSLLRACQPKDKEVRKLVDALTEKLEYSVLTRDMKGLAEAEDRLRTRAPEPNTLAVATIAGDQGAQDLTRFGRALSVMLTTDLARLPGLRLLERRKLDVLQGETQLAATTSPAPRKPDLAAVSEPLGVQQRLALLTGPNGEPYYTGAQDGVMGPATRRAVQAFQRANQLAADGIPGAATQAALDTAVDALFPAPEPVVERSTAPVAGRLLGAERVFGGIASVDNEAGDLVVYSQIVEVLNPDTAITLVGRRPMDDFYKLSPELTLQTADALGIRLSAEERKALLDLPPATTNLAAFLAFGHAVELEDRGQFGEAETAYRQALLLDPQFNLARDRVEVLSVDSAAFQQSVRRTLQAALGTIDARGALSGALGAVGTGMEEDRMRSDDKGDRTPAAEGPPNGSARVGGQIPVPQP